MMGPMPDAPQPKPPPKPPQSITRWSHQVGLLLVWALFFALGFAPFNVWPLAHLALVPLTVLALRGSPTRRVLLLSFAAGWAWWLVMIYWMIPVTGPGYVGLAAIEGAFVALYVWIIRLIAAGGSRRVQVWLAKIPFVLLVPIVWVGLEYVPGAIIVDGFPWFLIAHGQPTLLIQIADVIGVYGVSFVVAMTGGIVLDVIHRRWGTGASNPSKGLFRMALPGPALIGVLVLGLVAAYGCGFFNLPSTMGRVPHLIRIAVVQSNVPQSNKDHIDEQQEHRNFQQLMDLSEQALAQKPDLIVWPETMVPQALDEETTAVLTRLKHPDLGYRIALEQFAATNHVNMIVGAHAYSGWHETPKGGLMFAKRYNSAYLIQPTGGVSADRFDKIHRVPYGEYMPGADLFPWAKAFLLSLTPYEQDFTLQPGTRWLTFTVLAAAPTENFKPKIPTPPREINLATPICFEDVITDVPRQMVYAPNGEKRVDVLVNISNDGWFIGTTQNPQHESIARFRCVENRVPMARSVNTGISGFIDSSGVVTKRVVVNRKSQEVAGYAVEELWTDPRVTIYSRVGDVVPKLCLGATLAGLIAALVARKLSKRETP
jgi:apolipoprotein N-acyltransferase